MRQYFCPRALNYLILLLILLTTDGLHRSSTLRVSANIQTRHYRLLKKGPKLKVKGNFCLITPYHNDFKNEKEKNKILGPDLGFLNEYFKRKCFSCHFF